LRDAGPSLANDAVAAHELLNSSAVVSSAIATLQEQWDDLSAVERAHMLDRMATHSAKVSEGLRELTLGRLPH
jgi:hypothetical protein